MFPVSERSWKNNSWLSLTGADADAFFKIISSSHGRRLDDQRVALPKLPGIGGDTERKESGVNSKAGIPVSYITFKLLVVQARRIFPTAANFSSLLFLCHAPTKWMVFLFFFCQVYTPHINIAESTPTTSRKDCSRPASQPQRAYAESGSPRAIPKSASFTSEAEYQKKLNSPAQVNSSP